MPLRRSSVIWTESGVKTDPNGKMLARKLKASQAEMEGVKVAGMMLDPKRDPKKQKIWVSSDGYVIDGHHTWAAAVGRDAEDGNLDNDMEMDVVIVDMPMSKVYHLSTKWTRDVWASSCRREEARSVGTNVGARPEISKSSLTVVVGMESVFMPTRQVTIQGVMTWEEPTTPPGTEPPRPWVPAFPTNPIQLPPWAGGWQPRPDQGLPMPQPPFPVVDSLRTRGFRRSRATRSSFLRGQAAGNPAPVRVCRRFRVIPSWCRREATGHSRRDQLIRVTRRRGHRCPVVEEVSRRIRGCQLSPPIRSSFHRGLVGGNPDRIRVCRRSRRTRL